MKHHTGHNSHPDHVQKTHVPGPVGPNVHSIPTKNYHPSDLEHHVHHPHGGAKEAPDCGAGGNGPEL